MELAVEERGHFPGEPDHREQVDAVDHGRDVEHAVPDRERLEQRGAGLELVGKHDDPGVVLAQADLVLGQDHPPRVLAAQFALVEGCVQDRQQRSRKRDRDRCADLEVPGAAHDLAHVALCHIDLTDAQPVSVRVRLHREHLADEEAAEIAVEIGDADVDDALDLGGRDGQATRDLFRGGIHRHVLAQPGERGVHQNWVSSRGSLRQSSRRSGIPCRSTAMRSRPQPNAKPV